MGRTIWVVFLGSVGLLVPAWQSGMIQSQVEVCQTTQDGGPQHCSSYPLIPGVLAYVEAHNGLVTTFATIVIAIFTWRLYVATDKLWRAGEAQLGIFKESSLRQSADMVASTEAARIAAVAAAEGNDLTRDIFIAENRPWLALGKFTIVQGIKITDSEVVLEVEIGLKNYGVAPATDILLITTVFAEDIAFNQLPSLQEHWRQFSIKAPDNHRTKLNAIYAGQSDISECARVRISKSVVEKAVAERGRVNMLLVIGSFSYRMNAHSEYSKTGFIFRLTPQADFTDAFPLADLNNAFLKMRLDPIGFTVT